MSGKSTGKNQIFNLARCVYLLPKHDTLYPLCLLQKWIALGILKDDIWEMSSRIVDLQTNLKKAGTSREAPTFHSQNRNNHSGFI
jgi:hypothetical protein